MTNSQYAQAVKKASKPSPKIKDFVCAFVIGGLICVIGQLFFELYTSLGFTKDEVKMLVPVSLIFIAVVLTAFKVFDDIAKHAGAGTLVPITGFANAVVSPAVEFKPEGMVMGVGAKIFSIAGPVIAYGVIASVIAGICYYLGGLM